jgi:hypothetical protein
LSCYHEAGHADGDRSSWQTFIARQVDQTIGEIPSSLILFSFPQDSRAMPSPFPGMDPHLEAPHIWPDLHDSLAGELRNELNQTLPSPYYARLEMRPELGIIEDHGATHRIAPDVTIVRNPHPAHEVAVGGAAVLTAPRSDVSRFVEYEVLSEPIRHHFVEIRDSSQGHKLITLIEIVSPSNKRPGPDRHAYERKQRQVLESDASLVEIDLLRDGRRVLPDSGLETLIQALPQPPEYLVVVNRAWRRGPGASAFQVFPVGLREWLPCIPVPLKENEEELALDLQFAFNRAYDSGPYRRGAVDYSNPPAGPPFNDAAAAWAAVLTQPWRERAAE